METTFAAHKKERDEWSRAGKHSEPPCLGFSDLIFLRKSWPLLYFTYLRFLKQYFGKTDFPGFTVIRGWMDFDFSCTTTRLLYLVSFAFLFLEFRSVLYRGIRTSHCSRLLLE